MKSFSELTEVSFEEQVNSSGPPVIVDFYAPWCGSCKTLTPLLDKLAGHYAGRVRFVKVNVDDAPELSARFNFTGVPTLIFFKDGKTSDRVVGFASQRDLAAKLDSLAGTLVEASS